MMKYKRLFPFLLSLVLLVGCDQKSSTGGGSLYKDFVRLSIASGIRSLDPRIGIDCPSAHAITMLFDGLTRMEPNGEIALAVAKSYHISEDQKTYTFYFRDTIWSNGDPVTSFDFEYAWKSLIDPNKGESLGVENFYPIKNVSQILRGEKPIESVGVKALDEKTLRVELEHPTPYFLEILSNVSFFPVNKRVCLEDPNWANARGEDFVSNGPFCLQSHLIENEIVVKKNPTYWDAECVKIPGIQIFVIKDMNTQFNMFEKGDLEWVGNPLSKVPPEAFEAWKRKGHVTSFPKLGLYWFFLNVESFPIKNKKIRQALAYGVDRQTIVKHLLGFNELPAMGILPPSIASQDRPFFEDNNQEKAIELFNEGLEELGITREEFPRLTINYFAVGSERKVCEAIQQQWSSLLKIDVSLEHQDWAAHYGKLKNGNFQIGAMGWRSILRDPIYMLQTFRHKDSGVNMSGWENADYQNYLILAENEIDLDKRREFFNHAETILMEEMPVIPLFFGTISFSKNPHLKGVFISETYDVDFKWSYWEKPQP